jgi:hypothetical protein
MMTVYEDRRPAARQRRAGVRHDDVNTNPCGLWLVFTASYLTQTGRVAAGAGVRLQWRHDREVEVLSRHTLSGLYPTITASSRGDVGSNHWGVTSP